MKGSDVGIGLSAVLRLVKAGIYGYWCPGCADMHTFNISSSDHPQGKRWGWDGNVKCPTVDHDLDFPDKGCFHYLHGGKLFFRDNCTHAHAGRVVPLPIFPPPPYLAPHPEDKP